MQSFENGSGDLETLRANREAFRAVKFRPRGGGTPVAPRSLRTSVLGHAIDTPLIAASVGQLGAAHPDGEAGVARAFGRAGSIQFVSGFTSTPIETIMDAASGPVYYQLYYFGEERAAVERTIERVQRAGCAGLVICIDSAAAQTPARNLPIDERRFAPTQPTVQDAFRFAPQLVTKPRWVTDFLRGRVARHAAMALDASGEPMPFATALERHFIKTPTWADLGWLRQLWDCPVVIKGALTVEDARRAVDVGATGVVVSNHGGNRLDGTMPSLWALPPIVDAVGDEIDVLFDSGIRSGTDVIKALAIGAKAVLLGRAYLYPLVAAGEPGVARILDIFEHEMCAALSLLGCGTLGHLSRRLMMYPHFWDETNA